MAGATARLFVAVWPPAALVDQLRRLERPARPGLRWTTEDQWHVTLRFLGAVDEPAHPLVRRGLAVAAAGTGPVAASAGPSPRRLGSGVWVLPVAGLDDLAGRVQVATERIGRPPGGRRFSGHVTLARARRPGALAGLTGGPISAAWRVEELTLVCSELHPAGARYEVVDRWALGSSPPG